MESNGLDINPQTSSLTQYSIWQILGIWALGTGPTTILTWIVAPRLIPKLDIHPGILYWILMIIGMTWQFVLSLLIIRHELGTFTWKAIEQRTWLNPPVDPKTKKTNNKLFLWLAPCLLLIGLSQLGLNNLFDSIMNWLQPILPIPAYTDITKLANPIFIGRWWLLPLFLISAFLNYFLGEEFLFRGILLPKMNGVFGKWDWEANAVLFGLYHLHKPWFIPSIIAESLVLTWPAKRFKCNWFSVVIHGVEAIPLFFLVMGVITGLVF
jgi:membrane protease YdiL (CAAX protease family)